MHICPAHNELLFSHPFVEWYLFHCGVDQVSSSIYTLQDPGMAENQMDFALPAFFKEIDVFVRADRKSIMLIFRIGEKWPIHLYI